MNQEDREHFRSYRRQTRVKHLILERYLWAYYSILKKWHPDLAYIDGFAGRGTYDDEVTGERIPGSPLRALRLIANDSDFAAAVQAAFIEKDPAVFAELDREVRSFCEQHPHIRKPKVMLGTFARHATDVLDEVDGQVPTFLFADPCGVEGTSLVVIERLLKRPRCEAFIFFNLDGVRRVLGLGEDSPTLIDLVGSKENARELMRRVDSCRNAAQREETIVAYYKELLIESGVQFVTLFPVEKESRHTTSHYFIHATKHSLGFKIMKNIMWDLGSTEEGTRGLALIQASDPGDQQLLVKPRWEGIKRDIRDELEQEMRRVAYFYDTLTRKPDNTMSESGYREALLELESEGKILVFANDGRTARPASARVRGGRVTLGKDCHIALSGR